MSYKYKQEPPPLPPGTALGPHVCIWLESKLNPGRDSNQMVGDIIPDPRSDPDERLDRACLAEHISAAISTLDSREREIVERYCYGGQHLVEIAREMGYGESTVSRAWRIALRKMGTFLESLDVDLYWL